MFKGILPIGSVVLIGDSSRRVMIVGICQKGGAEGKLYDYTGVIYPHGYISSDKMFLFNHDQISRVFAVGYQDEEQFAFKTEAERVLNSLRSEEAK